jgi:hypothetical protein
MRSSNKRRTFDVSMAVLVGSLCAIVAPGCGKLRDEGGSRTAATSSSKTYTLGFAGVQAALSAVLYGLYLQFDQTDDYSHTANLTCPHDRCVPASGPEVTACLQNCKDTYGDDQLALKACNGACGKLEDCTPDVCESHNTYDYVRFGDGFKKLHQKLCIAPGDTCPPDDECMTPTDALCPRCTVGQEATTIEDIDMTRGFPRPVYSKDDASLGPIVCYLNTFGIDLC